LFFKVEFHKVETMDASTSKQDAKHPLWELYYGGSSFKKLYHLHWEAAKTFFNSKDTYDLSNMKEFEMIIGTLEVFAEEKEARLDAIDSFIDENINRKNNPAPIPAYLLQLGLGDKAPNRLKVKASRATVERTDQLFFKSRFMECGLCKRIMRKSDHEKYATACTECRCLVCFRCDCSVFHLSEQERLVEEAHTTTARVARKRRNRKKKKKDRKAAPEETRQDTPAVLVIEEAAIETPTELRDGIPGHVDLVDYLMTSGSILDLAAFMDQCESSGIDLDEGYIKELHFPTSEAARDVDSATIFAGQAKLVVSKLSL
jgi:hypothetical protein